MEAQNNHYMKGFVPFAIAAAALSLCGGFTAAVPANIVSDWALEETTVTWLALPYSLGAACMAPVMGKLADLLGRRTTLLLGLFLFTAGPLFTAICPTGYLALVMALRFLAGVGAAAIAPVVMSYIMTEFPQEKLGQGFTVYMLLSCGMVIFGPALGGIVIARAGWRTVMYVCTVFAGLALTCCFVLLKKEQGRKQSQIRFDIPGAILVVVFFSMLLSVPTFGQNNGWTAVPTLVSIVAGLVSLGLLIAVERKAENPILNGRFMARRQFILPVVVLFLSQGLLQSCMTNIITFAIVTTGDRTLSGIATSVMYVGMALGTIVIGPMADKREPRSVAAAALVFVAAGAALQMLFTASTGLLLMCASMFLIGLGLGGNGTIFMKVVLSGLDPQLAGSGSGTYNVFRDMSAPFGVALFVPLFSGRMIAGMGALIAQGIEENTAKIQAAVESLHSTALIQTLCVGAGIVVCLMLPKIYRRKIH